MLGKKTRQTDESQAGQLRLSLYENAIDSIKHAIEHYTSDPLENRRYKYAVLHLSQGTTLLLKERLTREHPNLIFANVADEGKTVEIEVAVSRLEKIAKIDLDPAKEVILELSRLRNRIEHYAVDISKQQADSIIGRIVPFLVSFVHNELGRSFQSEIGEANWQALLKIRDYRDSAIRSAEMRIKQEGRQAFVCPKCQAYTAVAVVSGSTDEGEWILSYAEIVCTVCSDVALIQTECRKCKRPLTLSPRATVPYYSYCEDCQTRLKGEFGGFESPTFVAEVRSWFQQNEVITTEQLYQLLRNVSTAGPSSRSRYLRELMDKGIIEFVDTYEKDHFLATKHLFTSLLEPYWRFKWVLPR